MRLNVRCCCQPTKILGTLDVNPTDFAARVIRIRTMEANVPPAKWGETLNAGKSLFKVHVERIEIRDFRHTIFRVEPAVYSEDRPVEFWRGLPSFKEGDAVLLPFSLHNLPK